jgi:ribose-phosphate pyrophosphokinase
VCPDAGRAATAEKFAAYLKFPLTITLQKRNAEGKSTITHVIGEVENRTPIIIEDIIDTGSTIVKVVEALKAKGANDAFICATHPVFSGPTIQRLNHPHIREVIVTDTIPLSEECPDYIKVISVSQLLAEAIRINMFGGSISTLFKIKSVY